jgi:DNA polymerase-4
VFVSARVVLHADLDAFFASVEQRDDASLRGRPVIVGGGVVLAASYEARAFGIRSAMGGAVARRLCPQAIVVRPRFEAYVEASKTVFAILDEAAPVVEQLSIDEAFLDVTGLERVSGPPGRIAAGLRRTVREEVGLPISVGVASSKHLAKVASAAAKPDGLLVVAPGREIAFLHPLAVGRMWGVGPATLARLEEAGIVTVGDLAARGEAALVELLGLAHGRRLHALAWNRDPRPVRRGVRRRSFGAQRALGRGARSAEELDRVRDRFGSSAVRRATLLDASDELDAMLSPYEARRGARGRG